VYRAVTGEPTPDRVLLALRAGAAGEPPGERSGGDGAMRCDAMRCDHVMRGEWRRIRGGRPAASAQRLGP
jgi:hypothetical protein